MPRKKRPRPKRILWHRVGLICFWKFWFSDFARTAGNLKEWGVSKPQVLQLVINLPHSFRLCDHHFELHWREYDADLDSDLHKQHPVVSCSWLRDNHISHPDPFAKTQSEEEDFLWDFDKGMKMLTEYMGSDFTILWNVFHCVDRAATPTPTSDIVCNWFPVLFISEFHKRHDRSDKCEERKVWLGV